MLPAPPIVLICPDCGGKKEVLNLASGNTFHGTLWSDTRRIYPMLPEVSPIQKCPHCGRYYFMEEAKSRTCLASNSYSNELGELNFDELKEAREQMSNLSLSDKQQWILNYQLFLAYNDKFRRGLEEVASHPSEEDESIFGQVVEELLVGANPSSDSDILQAELLRETGRFDQAKAILLRHESENERWVVDAMLKHIDQEDTMPFLLIKGGKRVP